jgi:hypothetical protein|tara:strand:- start:815 stop:1000 length:186 start_codon:yes stop_codon:yes gene_type:complete
MSDTVKKWHEMQEEIKTSLQADKEMASAGIGQENNKAYRILIDYDIKDIIRAIDIHKANNL